MTAEIVGLIGIIVLIVLLFEGVWIGAAMLFVGVWGIVYLDGFHRALGVLANVPYSSVTAYALSALPLFILMGVVLSHTGLGADLYDTANKWIGHLRGGLAMATVVACGLFSYIRFKHSYSGNHGQGRSAGNEKV